MRIRALLAAAVGIPRALAGWRCVSAARFWYRWRTCRRCEHLTAAGRCKKCGCFMRLKARLPAASCPEGKWGKVAATTQPGASCAGCERAAVMTRVLKQQGSVRVGSVLLETVRPPQNKEV